MFFRIFHITVQPGRQAEFRRSLELLTPAHVYHRSGLLSFSYNQSGGQDSPAFTIIAAWRDQAAEKFHSGKDWVISAIPPELLSLIHEVKIQARSGPDLSLPPHSLAGFPLS